MSHISYGCDTVNFISFFLCKQFSFSMCQTGMRDKHLKCPLTLLINCPLKCHFVFKKKLLVLGASLFEYVEQKQSSLNITLKFVGKITRKKWKILKIMKSNTPYQVQVLLHKHKFKIPNNFIKKRVPLWKCALKYSFR